MHSLVTCLVVLAAASIGRADSKDDFARTELMVLNKALDFYKKQRGNFPDELLDLKTAGIVEPKATFLDPWGNPYQYDAKGKRNGGKRPDVWAVTPDKKEIGNWLEEQKK
jgi:hypothetical protein